MNVKVRNSHHHLSLKSSYSMNLKVVPFLELEAWSLKITSFSLNVSTLHSTSDLVKNRRNLSNFLLVVLHKQSHQRAKNLYWAIFRRMSSEPSGVNSKNQVNFTPEVLKFVLHSFHSQ